MTPGTVSDVPRSWHPERRAARAAYARGRRNKARRYFQQSFDRAQKLGARYDEARALLDMARAFPDSDDHRQQGERLFDELSAVIPEVEKDQHPPNS